LSALILETDKEKFEKLVDDIKMDESIKEQLERIVMDLNIDDELVTKYYDLEEERKKLNNAVQERIAKENFEKGVREKQREIVLEMYKENLSIETISKCTKLSVEEINKLIKTEK